MNTFELVGLGIAALCIVHGTFKLMVAARWKSVQEKARQRALYRMLQSY